MTPLSGLATAENTAPEALKGAFLARRKALWPNGPWVSEAGFGSYRIGFHPSLGAPESGMALEYALRDGVNLVDTSTNYGDGQSELLIGRTIAKLVAEGALKRETFVLISKVGYVQGQNHDLAMSRIKENKPFPDMVKFGENIWHCIHPEFIRDQVLRSCARLGVKSLDVFLLHNPEYALKHFENCDMPVQEARNIFYSRIKQSFECLEELVKEGTIGAYGVSSNTFGQPEEDPSSVSAQKLWDIACKISVKNNFKVIQFPLNLIEVGPAFMPMGADGSKTTLQFALEHSLGTLVNRPFNAMYENGLIRLTRPVVHEGQEMNEKTKKGLENWTQLANDVEKLGREHLNQTVGYEDAPLSQLVLALLSSLPGITSVLCGMRRKTYVQDAQAALTRPRILRGLETFSRIYEDLEFHN